MFEFKLPDLGEGVESGTVVAVLVNVGDAVAAEQPVVEIEADKATVELPCPHAGTVHAVHVKVGDQLTVGDPVLSLAGGAAAPAKQEATVEAPAKQAAKTEAPAPKPQPVAAAARGGNGNGHGSVAAGPAVRRLARLLGVDLGGVSGSGQRGRITTDDVHAYLQQLKSSGGGGAALPPLPDFSKWGAIEEEPLSGVRRSTAQAMARAWSTIPHVTHFDLSDITELEAGRKAFRKANPDVKLTMTVVLLKALGVVLEEFPKFNASLDLAGGKLIYKKHYHVGIAVDTPQGLLVPVVRDVDQKSAIELSAEVTELAKKARDRKLGREDMRGGTFTVSNLGGIGGIGFTPIVNWPEVAILGVSRARQEYRPGPDGPELRLIMPTSLSYDHRVIDGAEAARFSKRLGELLSSPAQLVFSL
jgi:pyruvate dehydrogenase E2 component (dihydrolipoamide acetyltransferase)